MLCSVAFAKLCDLSEVVKRYSLETVYETQDCLMPKGRPRQFDTEQALEAALLLFWRQGYEGTSLAALSEAMGVNMPSLYAAFGNKETLFQQVVERYLQRPASYLPEALCEPTARAAIEKLFEGAIKMVMHPRHPDGCLLVQGALVSGPAADSIQRSLSNRRAGAEAAIRRRLEQAVAAGELPSQADAARLARFFATVLWGMSVQAAGGATRKQLKEVAEQALLCWPK
ncbi:MAG: TetR/AcrR family transcriptional regulator [Pirellulaceae bacterium]